MCRINGILDFKNSSLNTLESIAIAMRDTMMHGGPDDAGIFVDQNLALGHRRLSILDLSSAGHQPMLWQNYAIVYNGEIYNFKEIRTSLEKEGYVFETNTDTEVILKGFHCWEKEVVKRFRGMFAIAIWDKQKCELLLCRDRIGVKPLYWYWKDELFLFASEMKAFHEHPNFDKSINLDAVSLFLQQGYIQAPYSIYKYAHKLEQGSFLTINQQGELKEERYWNAEKVYEDAILTNRKEGEILEELEEKLIESFQYRMVADVPVGMFLSGGIDSSLVTALLQAQYNQPIKTFTIGFEKASHNEAKYAQKVAQHIGTEHRELYCTPKQFEELIPKLPDLYDEPFGAGSAIPTYMVSQLAKEEVKVSLSADGGDEIFAGYTKYEIAQKWQQKIATIPSVAKNSLSFFTNLINPQTLANLAPYLPVLKNYTNIESKFFKFQNALSAKSIEEFFLLSSAYVEKEKLERLHSRVKERLLITSQPKERQLLSYLGMLDMNSYLEGEIMTKVDRATMHTALEGREPFLDQHLIEFAFTLPDELKMKNGVPKYLLRKVLYKYVPKELIERPKQGFDIPIDQWLHGFLKSDLEIMVEDKAFSDTFQFNQQELKQIISSFFVKEGYTNPHFVWFLYVLYKWYLRWS